MTSMFWVICAAFVASALIIVAVFVTGLVLSWLLTMLKLILDK